MNHGSVAFVYHFAMIGINIAIDILSCYFSFFHFNIVRVCILQSPRRSEMQISNDEVLSIMVCSLKLSTTTTTTSGGYALSLSLSRLLAPSPYFSPAHYILKKVAARGHAVFVGYANFVLEWWLIVMSRCRVW